MVAVRVSDFKEEGVARWKEVLYLQDFMLMEVEAIGFEVLSRCSP